MNRVSTNNLFFSRVNQYDLIVFVIIALVALCFVVGYNGMHEVWHPGQLQKMSLNITSLPYDTLRTVMRLMYGLVFSFIFAFAAGTLAAKNKHAARVILPFINFMESVPLVGFLTFSVIFFMHLYPHSIMGLEYTAIFGVFTGQAWNMALSVYQTIAIVPPELKEAADAYGLSAWQRYWKIEVPYSVPGLLWNTMVSQSAAWFALVATEAISMGSNTLYLPGIGSYIQLALTHENYKAILYAVVALIITIVFFDQLAFRPLVRWSEKFKFERVMSRSQHSSWFYTCAKRTLFLNRFFRSLRLSFQFVGLELKKLVHTLSYFFRGVSLNLNQPLLKKACLVLWYIGLASALAYTTVRLIAYLPKFDVSHMLWLMLLTTMRVFLAMLLSLLIFVPLGIWIGLSPKLTRVFQPVIQVLSALPPNILYPLMAIFLIGYHQSLGWWCIPLIMLGTQWYILFNVLAGVSTLPQDMRDLVNNFNLKGLYSWRKVIIPAIFPYIVTGVISAAGGAWNADITAEVVQWGRHTLSTTGLGAFVANTTNANITDKAALGCVLMCILVALCVVFIWRPLYRLAENKYSIR